MRQVSNGLVSDITAQANSLESSSLHSAIIVSVATLLLLILVLLITTFVARSMIRPLRKLRADALEVAGSKLPDMVRRLSESEGGDATVEIEPIGVTSTDEIGEVARAFDQVHREAVRLAADEAMLRGNLNAMFVNLSRRSQSLIERQLSLIDNLEQTEQDADRLSSLFRLDHLATRMRRNSENLLVLAGHEAASRRWSQPVPLVDVLRAAISEIEQYERVVLNVQPGIQVVGQAVNDMVHLVAEIVENATTFSPEDTQVYVTGPAADQRWRAARHHRQRRGHLRAGDGARELAPGQPAGRGRRGVPPHGPVRGRPPGGQARRPGPAAARAVRRSHRADLAARVGRRAGERRSRSAGCASSRPTTTAPRRRCPRRLRPSHEPPPGGSPAARSALPGGPRGPGGPGGLAVPGKAASAPRPRRRGARPGYPRLGGGPATAPAATRQRRLQRLRRRRRNQARRRRCRRLPRFSAYTGGPIDGARRRRCPAAARPGNHPLGARRAPRQRRRLGVRRRALRRPDFATTRMPALGGDGGSAGTSPVPAAYPAGRGLGGSDGSQVTIPAAVGAAHRPATADLRLARVGLVPAQRQVAELDARPRPRAQSLELAGGRGLAGRACRGVAGSREKPRRPGCQSASRGLISCPDLLAAARSTEDAPPARSADTIRSRMASFQRGVREARAAAPQNEEP